MNRFLFAKHAEDRAPWTAARRPAGFVARSSRTAPGTHRRSRLASGPGGLQQNANLFRHEPLETTSWNGTRRMDPGIRNIVLSRLEADGPIEKAWGALVRAALEGASGIEAELSGSAAAPRSAVAQVSPAPAGAFLQSIAVEGFRGIGPAQTLELRPGPGLTLFVGRNGSGKSSFAEALEVLLTGDSLRWKERAAVWREGWRNLHHPAAALGASFLVEGQGGPCRVSRRWEPSAAFDAAET